MTDPNAYVDELIGRATEAAREWARFDQAATDRIVTAIFRAAFAKRVELAQRASDEAGIGTLLVPNPG